MKPETLQWLVENWNDIAVSLLVFLFAIGVLWLFFTDRLLSPKSIGDLRESVRKVGERCDGLEETLELAEKELSAAQVNYAKAAERITFQEETIRRLEAEKEDLRRRVERLEVQLEFRPRTGGPE